MKITIKQAKEFGACSGGLEWLRTQKDKGIASLAEAAISEKTFTPSSGIIADTFDYANWGLVHIMDQRQGVMYACFAARCVVKNHTNEYPNDKRVIKAILAAERWIRNPSEDNRGKAEYAADAAATAAGAAYDAARSAGSAYYAATAAATAAYAAAYAADAAYYAYCAAEDAAGENKIKAQILRFGAKILIGGVK